MKNRFIFTRFALPTWVLTLFSAPVFAQATESPKPGASDWLPAAFTVLLTLLAGVLVLAYRSSLKKVEAARRELVRAKQELGQIDQLRLELSKARQRRTQLEDECKRLEQKVAVLEKEKKEPAPQRTNSTQPQPVNRPMPTTPDPPSPPTPSPPPVAPLKPTPPPVPVPEPTFFLPLPNPDGSFADERATTFNPAESLYRFRLDKNPLEATFEFADDPATVAAALRYPDNCLAPVCEYGSVDYAARRIQTVSAGRARLARPDSGRWELVSKAVIRFV